MSKFAAIVTARHGPVPKCDGQGGAIRIVTAILGGVAGVYGSVRLAGWLGWLATSEQGGALIGGLLAFGLAAIIAVSTIHTPVGPVLSGALVGAGVLLGAGASRA